MVKRFSLEISVSLSNSHNPDLSKADTCLKRTTIFAPKVSALDKFHCSYPSKELDICEYGFAQCQSTLLEDRNFTPKLLILDSKET